MSAESRLGYFYAFGAFIMWGVFPVYFKFLTWLEPEKIVAHRAVWSLLFVLTVLTVRKELRAFLRSFGSLKGMSINFISGVLIAANWLIFIYAVSISEINSAGLGYFISPVVSIVIGSLILKERLSVYDKSALISAFVGIALNIYFLGKLPLISLGLALTFGFYGYVRKIAKEKALVGFSVEVTLLFPFFACFLFFTGEAQRLFDSSDYSGILLIIGTGIITALPLLFFAEGVKRIPLSKMGMLNYITPSLQVLTGTFIYGESLGWERLLTFIFIWIALGIHTYGKYKNISASG